MQCLLTRQAEIEPCQSQPGVVRLFKYWWKFSTRHSSGTVVITGDETWIYSIKTKAQSLQWVGESLLWPEKKNKACQSQSRMKVMLIIFFFLIGWVSLIMSLLHEDRQSVSSFTWTSWSVSDCVTKEIWRVGKQDLDPAPWQCTCSLVTYLWIFDKARVKSAFKDHWFQMIEEIRKFAAGPLHHSRKQVLECFPEMEKKMLGNRGRKYFEGDNSH